MDVFESFRALYTPTTIATTTALFFSAFLLYRWLLPAPIAGIPFNAEATKSIFGDVPSMMAHLKTHETIIDWIECHNTRHNSPIVQVFANLFGRPWVVIKDFRESQDILMRRTKEFDKPDLLSEVFVGVNPDHHTVKATNDSFRSQRKLLQDLMAPNFLNVVVAPQLHNNFMDLIQMWKEKVRLSKGHPFSVKHDIYNTALEAIWAAVFGTEETTTITGNQIDLLAPMKNLSIPAGASDEAVEFPQAHVPDAFKAVLELTDSIVYTSRSPFPILTGYVLRWLPFVAKWIKVKNQAMAAQISKAEQRLANSKGKAANITNAVDHILRRELMAAERQGRSPNFQSKIIVAELFGLLIAGHDTTSTTLLWAMKMLEANQDVQNKLRAELRSAFSSARSEGRVPTAQEVANVQSHYLDACIEEFIRCSRTAVVLSRTALTDVVVLGHVIPKGTMVLLPTSGGTLEAPWKIDDKSRNQTYHNADGGKVGEWDKEDIEKFKPERWLVHDPDTNSKVYDAQAGPNIMFGAGPRGCFGKKLAYLELKLAIVLIVWSFELQQLPERYASWDAMDSLTHSPITCYAKLAEA